MHFRGPDQRHGFSERLVGDISSPEIGYEIQELGELQGGADQHRVSIEKSGPGHSIVIDYDTTVVRSACNFLQNYDYKKPLFLMIGLFGPHCPFVCSENLYTYYNDVLPEPDDFTDIKRNIHPAIAKWYEYREVREVPIERVHAARSAYYGLIECTDSYLGEIMNTIEQTLGFEHTLVIYSSDHGDMIGDKGLFWKTNFYEGSARVPLLMRYPGKISGGSHIQQPATLMDIGPTISDFCKADHLPQRDGESLFPVLSGSQDQQDERAIISQLGDVKGDTPSVMVRKGPWKLVDHVGYEAPQLFDIFSDSDELDDLGDEPDFRDIIHDLRNELSGKWDGQYVAKQVELAKSVIPIMRKASWDKNPEHISEWWRGEKDRNFITR
jgi:choline-sulfatase